MQDRLNWSPVWQELRDNLSRQPRCPNHSQYTYVKTSDQRVINDIIDVEKSRIKVRSHRTMRERSIEAILFEVWWNHLIAKKSASLIPSHPNNPDRWNSRIVGAIIATCLPDKIRVINHNTIELIL